MKSIQLFLISLVGVISLAGCGGSSNSHPSGDAPQLRVVHLSPDAPAVDVSIDDVIALSDVSYRQASGFLPINTGSKQIKVLAAGTNTAVIDTPVQFDAETKYTIIAADTLANIGPIVISDDFVAPANGNAQLRVVHGAPAAPAVDVYVSAPDVSLPTSPTLANVPFKTVSDELEVVAGDYRVRVTAAGSSDVLYDSGTLPLAAGVEYVALASEVTSTVSPIGLTILTDSNASPVVLVEDTNARLRVVHASPDAPAVNIAVNDSNVLTNVVFGVGSDYLKILSDTYNVDVNVASNLQNVIDTDLTLDPSTDYTVAAVGLVSDIGPLVLVDDNTPPASGNVKVRLVHAAPSAGNVDVYISAPSEDINKLTPTVSNFEFKKSSAYLEVPAGDYRVRITPVGSKNVVIDTGTLSLVDGQVRTAFAIDPKPHETAFGVILLNDLN